MVDEKILIVIWLTIRLSSVKARVRSYRLCGSSITSFSKAVGWTAVGMAPDPVQPWSEEGDWWELIIKILIHIYISELHCVYQVLLQSQKALLLVRALCDSSASLISMPDGSTEHFVFLLNCHQRSHANMVPAGHRIRTANTNAGCFKFSLLCWCLESLCSKRTPQFLLPGGAFKNKQVNYGAHLRNLVFWDSVHSLRSRFTRLRLQSALRSLNPPPDLFFYHAPRR